MMLPLIENWIRVHCYDYHNPSVYIEEVLESIESNLNMHVSTSTVCRVMRRYGITRKRIRQVAKQRCDSLRGAFMAQSFVFKSRNICLGR